MVSPGSFPLSYVNLECCITALISVVNGGRRGANTSPGKLNVKTLPHLAYILVFRFLLVFRRLLFLAFFRVFSGDFVLQYRHLHPNSLSYINFFKVLASGPPSDKIPALFVKNEIWVKRFI